MPSASRNANRKRRIRRNITLLKRAGYQEALAKTKAMIHLYTLLAQSGREVTFTQGTLNQVVNDLKNLSYTITLNEAKTEFVMRLVTQTEPETETDPGRAIVPDISSELTD